MVLDNAYVSLKRAGPVVSYGFSRTPCACAVSYPFLWFETSNLPTYSAPPPQQQQQFTTTNVRTMKTSVSLLVLISALSASAFVPIHRPDGSQTALRITKEEDLELTRKVIAKFWGDDFASEPSPAPAPAPAAAAAAETAAPAENGKKSKK